MSVATGGATGAATGTGKWVYPTTTGVASYTGAATNIKVAGGMIAGVAAVAAFLA